MTLNDFVLEVGIGVSGILLPKGLAIVVVSIERFLVVRHRRRLKICQTLGFDSD